MTIEQEKNKFLASSKGIKAIAYARKYFDDFNSSKLEYDYLAIFFKQDVTDYEQYIATDINSYEELFWHWFRARYNRLMTEQQIGIDLIQARKDLAALDAANPLNWFEDFFKNILGSSKYIPILLIGALAVYGYSKIKK